MAADDPRNVQGIGILKGIVTAAFAKIYPGKTASWETEKGNFEAGLTQSGKPVSLLFAANGELLETETAINQKELPGTVLAYIHDRYPGIPVRETARIVKPDGSFTYEAEVNKKDLIFSDAGKFLRSN